MWCCVMQVVGMGLLLTFIGLQTSKIVVPDKETMVRLKAPATQDWHGLHQRLIQHSGNWLTHTIMVWLQLLSLALH